MIAVYVLGSLMMLVLFGALLGIAGPIVQSIAILLAILLALIAVNLFMGVTVRLLNRTCRYCREALETETEVADRKLDPATERLKARLDAMRQQELSFAERYSHRRCSSDEWIRARSLRVQAEIEWLRTEGMPRPWVEVRRGPRASRS